MADFQQGRKPVFVPACVYLRTKTQYYRVEDMDQAPGMIADSQNLCYWCALTEDPVGPDRQSTAPDQCQQHRRCFVDANSSHQNDLG